MATMALSDSNRVGQKFRVGVKIRFFLLAGFMGLGGMLQARADHAIPCQVAATFSSEASLADAVSGAIRQTRSSLWLALYGFTNPELASELTQLAKRGVTVRLKVDASKGQEKKTARILSTLRRAGVEVRLVAPEGRNHNKFVVIDESLVLTGSYNWTLKAESNWENLLLLDCPELARRYIKEWQAIR